MTREDPPRFSTGDLARFLVAPDAGERLSPLGGPGALVLDLVASPSAEAAFDRARILDALPALPCVTIGIDPTRGEGSMTDLAQACDVVVSDDDDLATLLAGFEATPIAALAFVQLLRSAMSSSVQAGLVSESFVYSTLQSGAEFQEWLADRRRRTKQSRPEAGRPCRLDRDRDRLEIHLSRPGKRNAFSREMRDALVEALQLVWADPSIEDVVLRGDGVAFCSGGDLDEFGQFPDPAEAHVIRSTRSPAMWMARLSGRIRAEVHGACIGAGVELPAFLEHVDAYENSFFQLPEVGLGLVPGAGGTVSLPRRIGRQRTAWLGLSGRPIDARTALDWGLVDEVRLGEHP